MVPPRYVWITYGWYPEAFWKQSPSNGTSYQAFDQCSRQQLISIVNQMIIIHHYPRYDKRDEGNPIIGNQVRSRIWQYQRNICTKYTDPCLELEVILPYVIDKERNR